MIEYPDGPARGGVLVFHGGAGRGEHERARVAELAASGFIAAAPDLFGEAFRDRAHGVAVIQRLVSDPVELRARAAAALAELAARTGRIAVIGHCFGGFGALELARSGADLCAAISVHGRLATAAPAARGCVRARVLACTGADDRFCPRAERAAFEVEPA